MRAPLPALLAVVIPLVVWGLALQGLRPGDDPSGKAGAMEATLARAPDAQVLVLGSSLARTGLRTEVLAERLGLPPDGVVLLTLPNATAAHWYAILKNRVYANGYRPRAVLVVGALTTMLTPDVLKDANVSRLVNQLGADEPVIDRKVFGGQGAWSYRWRLYRAQASALRDDWLDDGRDRTLAWAFRRRDDLAFGERLAQRTNAVIFADEAMDYALHRRGGFQLEAVEELEVTELDVRADSFVVDLARLAGQHEATTIFVRTPFPPSNPDNDWLPPAVEAEAEAVMAEEGALYLDLRGLDLEEQHFRDMRHLTFEGAARFTRALGDTLAQLGVPARSRPGGWAPSSGRPAGIVRSRAWGRGRRFRSPRRRWRASVGPSRRPSRCGSGARRCLRAAGGWKAAG